MDDSFTLTMTMQKKDHSLFIDSGKCPSMMWAVAALRQAQSEEVSWSHFDKDQVVLTISVNIDLHSIELSSTAANVDWNDAIIAQALEHFVNESRFLFAVIKQQELAQQNKFQGLITDLKRPH